MLGITLAIYYGLPFLRWSRGGGAPDQAVLIDLPNRRFYFFFIEIWPQEVYYLTGLLILAAMALFLMNAVAGRVWCGYLCPQTVWTDLFQTIERWLEGDRREHLLRDQQPWSIERLARTGVFNPQFVQAVLAATPHERLRWHYFMLWQMIGVELWRETFVESATTAQGASR